jgi:hypothetical protein
MVIGFKIILCLVHTVHVNLKFSLFSFFHTKFICCMLLFNSWLKSAQKCSIFTILTRICLFYCYMYVCLIFYTFVLQKEEELLGSKRFIFVRILSTKRQTARYDWLQITRWTLARLIHQTSWQTISIYIISESITYQLLFCLLWHSLAFHYPGKDSA